MAYAHVFEFPKGRVILTDEHSTLGYNYPRLFVESHEATKYTNVDLTLGAAFKQEKQDFESWIDGTEKTGEDFRKVCEEYDLPYLALETTINNIQDS